MALFNRILVPTDFSTSAPHTIKMAVAMARQFGASLALLHVTEVPAYAYTGMMAAPLDLLTPVLQAGEQELATALKELQVQMPGASSILRSGAAADEIIAAARAMNADLVVIGAHGRRGVGHLLLGSVAERVVQLSRVPVLTVHGEG